LKVSIKAMRVNAGLTQAEVANRVKINVATLISWENSRTYPTVEKLKELCKLYGCTIDDIFLPQKLSLT
jgi:DNA-binding XRE family transcriptional regulator